MHLLYCFLLQVLVKLMLNIMVSETVPVYWELGLVLVPENEDGLIICMIGCWRAVAGNCGFLPGYSHNFMLSNWKTITLGNHQCSLNAMQISQIYLFLYMYISNVKVMCILSNWTCDIIYIPPFKTNYRYFKTGTE